MSGPEECAVLKPMDARFVVNRLFLGTRLGAEVRDALAAFPQPVLTAAIRNRTEYAAALRVGQTALDTKPSGPAARDIVTLTDEIRAIALQEEDPACPTPLSGDSDPVDRRRPVAPAWRRVRRSA